MKGILILILVISIIHTNTSTIAQDQDYGCDKCSMLREEYELAVSPKKEEIFEFFKSQCLETDTMYFSESGAPSDSELAETIRITAIGKCIDYKDVTEVVKKTGKHIMNFNVMNKDTVYTIGTKLPAFPGGDVALVKYLSQNLRYPVNNRSNVGSGTVYVQFIVLKTGFITGIKVLRSPDESFSQEAVRVAKAMPKWIPGEDKGKLVNMIFNLPVRVNLK